MNDYTNHEYDALVTRITDGDSIWVHLFFDVQVPIPEVDVGFRFYLGGGTVTVHAEHELEIRVNGCDAPEKSTAAGKAALAYIQTLLAPGMIVRAKTYKPDRNAGAEKYGRWLADVALPDGRDLATVMIETGHAKPYTGGPR